MIKDAAHRRVGLANDDAGMNDLREAIVQRPRDIKSQHLDQKAPRPRQDAFDLLEDQSVIDRLADLVSVQRRQRIDMQLGIDLKALTKPFFFVEHPVMGEETAIF